MSYRDSVDQIQTMDIPDDVLVIAERLFEQEESWKAFLTKHLEEQNGTLDWSVVETELEALEAKGEAEG